jgi:hypothetical protein
MRGSVPIDEDFGLRTLRRLVPGLPSPAGFLALVAVLVALGPGLPRMFGSDGDTGRHIRIGASILSSQDIPSTDALSHTRYGSDWVLHEWLSQTSLAMAERAGGLAGVAVFAAILFSVAVSMTYVNAIVLGGSLRAALGITTVGMLLQLVHLLPRPHLVTTALASILLFLLIQYRRTADLRWVVAIPLLFVVWANAHGGFPVGLVLLTLFVADVWLVGNGPMVQRQRRTLAAALVLSAIATLLNPAGPALWSYVFGHLFGDELLIDVTQEFQSPDFHAPWGKLLLIVILGVAVFLRSNGKRLPALGLLILLGTLAATLVSARHISLLAVLGLPWLASPARLPGSDAREPGNGSFRWPLQPLAPRDPKFVASTSHFIPLVAAVALILVTLGPLASRARYDATTFPVHALHELDGSVPTTGPVFNQMEWGGYLLYAHPDIPVFIDGQTDFYGEDLVREYFAAHHGAEGWSEVLDRYQIQWTLTRSGASLNQLLEAHPDWLAVLDDGVAAVYRRDHTGRTGSDQPGS